MKCSIEMFLFGELQPVMLCLVLIAVQVNSSQMMCLDFKLLFQQLSPISTLSIAFLRKNCLFLASANKK